MVRRSESCQGVDNPDCVNMLCKQEQHMRPRCIIHERCEWGLRHLVVESGDALEDILPGQVANLCSMVDITPNQNPFQADSLNIASYTILWSLPTRLYLCPSITSVIDPSEITPDPTHSILHRKLVIADEDVESSPTSDGLVFFGVWHPSKQPSQVLTWHPRPVCLGSLHITLWRWSDDSGLHSHAIDPVRCALSTGRLLRAVYIFTC